MISEWEWIDVRRFYVATIESKKSTPYATHAQDMLIIVDTIMSDPALSHTLVDMRFYDIRIAKNMTGDIISISSNGDKKYVLSKDEFATKVVVTLDTFTKELSKMLNI
jgi:hypothetical protein